MKRELYEKLSIDKKILVKVIEGKISNLSIEALIFWATAVICLGKFGELALNYEISGYFNPVMLYYLVIVLMCLGIAWWLLEKSSKKKKNLEEEILSKYFKIEAKK